MKKIKQASMLYDSRSYKAALDVWPNYPSAWQAYYENNRATFHKDGYEQIVEKFIKPMLAACPFSSGVVGLAGDISMRYGQWDEALNYFKKLLELKPQAQEALMNMAHVFRNMAKQSPEKAPEYFAQAHDLMTYCQGVNLQSAHECISWQYKDSSQIPMPSENN